jgi:hypothetical protein
MLNGFINKYTMAKVIFKMSMSPDGYITGLNDDASRLHS